MRPRNSAFALQLLLPMKQLLRVMPLAVVLAGQVGLAGHIKIGAGAKIAAKSGIMADIPPGASYGGYPAVPVVDWHRQTIAISRLIKPKRGTND